MNNLNTYISLAKAEAEKSTYKYKLGALVLDGNRIVAKGYNKLGVHPHLSRKYGYWSKHAECDSILKAAGRGDVLIVVRIRKGDGQISCSKPCSRCLMFAKDYGIKKIYYVDWAGEIRYIKI